MRVHLSGRRDKTRMWYRETGWRQGGDPLFGIPGPGVPHKIWLYLTKSDAKRRDCLILRAKAYIYVLRLESIICLSTNNTGVICLSCMQISRVSGWLGIAFSLFEPSGIYNLLKSIDWKLKTEHKSKFQTSGIKTERHIRYIIKLDTESDVKTRKYEISLFGFVTLLGERNTPTG